ncbi:MAG: transposase [Chloroflexota bacterium]
MIRAHKIRLNPTPEQQTYLMKAAGTARYAYNWAVAQWRAIEGRKPGALALKKQFNAEKPAWAYEVTKCAAEGAFTDFGVALSNFYAGRAHAPEFKQRSKGHFKFKINNDRLDVVGHWVKIPKLGLVNLAENLRFDGKILGATVSREAAWWYISITVERPDSHGCALPAQCGIDAGLLRLATLSDGITIEAVRPLRNLRARIKRLQQLLETKQKGSHNREKLKAKIARLHKQVRDIRDDLLHKLTTWLARNYGFIAVEDLNVAGMLQNHKLALSLSDAALGRMLALLESKVVAHNGEVVKVGRFFPSSKTCVRCKAKRKKLSLSERTFTCANCGFTLDRDWNAAINILHEGLRVASNTGRPVVAMTDVNSPLTGYNLDQGLRMITFDHIRIPER